MNDTAEFLMQLADKLDSWKRQSIVHGTSGSHYEAEATKCRAVAARLYRSGCK